VKSNPSTHRNPAPNISKKTLDHFRQFHGCEPSSVSVRNVTFPLNMVGLGAVDVGYYITNRKSSKDGTYVHDFKRGVKAYRRCKRGETPTRVFKTLPVEVIRLGEWPGATIRPCVKGKCASIEVTGGRSKILVANRKMAIVLGPRGVEWIFTGGRFRINDWMYD